MASEDKWVERGILRFPFAFYVGGIFLLTFGATFAFVRALQALEVQRWTLIFCAITFLLSVSQLAVTLLNWLVTLLVSPRLFRGWIIPPALHRKAAPWWSFPRSSSAWKRSMSWSRRWRSIIWRIATRICISLLLTDWADAASGNSARGRAAAGTRAHRNRNAQP